MVAFKFKKLFTRWTAILSAFNHVKISTNLKTLVVKPVKATVATNHVRRLNLVDIFLANAVQQCLSVTLKLILTLVLFKEF